MQPLNVRTHPAFSSNIVAKVFRQISDRAAVRMARTCKFGLEQTTTHKKQALDEFEQEVKTLRGIEDEFDWGRPISYREGREELVWEQTRRESKKRQVMSWLVGDIGENMEEKKKAERRIELLKEYLSVLTRLSRMGHIVYF